jgi:hypothetical protein
MASIAGRRDDHRERDDHGEQPTNRQGMGESGALGGFIFPPGVVAYKEWDAFNIWQSGEALDVLARISSLLF